MSFWGRLFGRRGLDLEVEQLLAQPWAMEPSALSALVEVLRGDALASSEISARQQRVLDGAGTYSLADGVATVPVAGVLMKSVPDWFAKYGLAATSVRGIQTAVEAAANDPDVKAIMLHVDSPGGTSAGLDELADSIYSLRGKKPVFTHTDDMMASAALWLGVQASRVTASRTAFVGSIGAYLPVHDLSEAYAKEGVKVHVVSTHELKGAGYAGSKVTEAHLADVQRIVDGSGAFFRSAVERGRGLSTEKVEELATGQIWYGHEAAKLGLVDVNMTFAEARASAAAFAAGSRAPAAEIEPAKIQISVPADLEPATFERRIEAAVTATMEKIMPEPTQNPTAEQQLAEANRKLALLEAEKEARAAAESERLTAQKMAAIEAGVNAGRITPAMRPSVEKFARNADASVADVEQFIANCPVLTHPKPIGQAPAAEPGADAPAGELRSIEKALGVPVAFQKALAGIDHNARVLSVAPDGLITGKGGTLIKLPTAKEVN